METDKNYLASSGINNQFYGDGLDFEAYIDLMRDIILAGRIDLDTEDVGKIVVANSPFSWQPQSSKIITNGVLLLHGLFDSPYYVRDLGDYFLNKGFLVNSILLPGHGTVPGDLLNIRYQEWLKCLQYGINSLKSKVKNIYLAGYSLGGLLAIYGALTNPDIVKGLVLIAPAIKPRSAFKFFLAKYYRLFSWMSNRTKWYLIKDNANFAKYSCYAFNAGYQARQVMNLVNNELKHQKILPPIFTVVSKDDETISFKGLLSFFAKQDNPQNRLIIYSNDYLEVQDPRMILRPSLFPHLKIINFSHSCLTISPDNLLLGADSQYIDLNHYHNPKKLNLEDYVLGAATKENLKKCIISRLSYNPDFKFMLKALDNFLLSTSTT